MQDPIISLITVSYNAQNTIEHCIRSVITQTYQKVQFIIIDGGSTDNTLSIIQEYQNHLSVLVSEPDKGIYDAMNKGIQFATGDIIGILNADDVFATDDVLAKVASIFNGSNAEILYGNLEYVKPGGQVVRKWYSGAYRPGLFNWGWMPPHPTFYCKRAWFKKLGGYKLEYGTAADYELMLRYIHVNKLTVCYLNEIMVKMNMGGASNKSYLARLKAWQNDLAAMRNNQLAFPLVCVIFKPLRKIGQYFK